MADEIMQETFDESQKYIEEINNLKQNSVSKEDYLKLQNENRNLLKSLVEGQTVSTEAAEEPKRSVSEIVKDLTSDSISNLDYLTYSLELHDRRLEEGYNDFLPIGHQISPTDEDIAAATQVEDFLRELVETADGNRDVFNNEYQRRVVDSIPAYRRR